MTPSPDAIAAVSQRLARFVEAREGEWVGSGPEAVAFVRAGASALSGGKRLRARFCLAGWRAVAEADDPAAVPGDDVTAAAAALEVFHAAALVHDDLIDNSDTRRGRPAAHRALEAHHARSTWAGSAEAFGRSSAILLGDLLVAWSDDLLEDGLRTAPCAPAAREVYALMRREVTVGQFLDIAEEAAFITAPDGEHAGRALRVASLKSARYSIQHPLLLGAALAGADAAQSGALSAFGHPLGLAFQLRDDVLGVFGDSAVTGKPSGDDLREGKRTVLVAYARERMDDAARHRFDAQLGDPTLDAAQIASLQETIAGTGALERVEALIDAYADEADEALRDAALAPAAVETLRGLAQDATARTA
ncbi:polyprenyl synthetase family protein [Microbacterium flavum]|uniref:Polyprenyl synthetase family protein n=1 Tax=Microbacterium flavum TaxID=415216 RepID=A0ABS5XSX7_9MICO|nr:polyprenyl synthetase family protein [Microbacterium flavum]MBT8797047.1 polyprenyl synthetase family protein [Microbacterium flavum]